MLSLANLAVSRVSNIVQTRRLKMHSFLLRILNIKQMVKSIAHLHKWTIFYIKYLVLVYIVAFLIDTLK